MNVNCFFVMSGSFLGVLCHSRCRIRCIGEEVLEKFVNGPRAIRASYYETLTRPTRPHHYPDDWYGSPQDHYPMTTESTSDISHYRPNQRKPHRHTSEPGNNVPDKCNTTYDAISIIRREIFIFKGRYVWRIGNNGPYEGYPITITRLFNLPENIDHVDAVYEKPDKRIVLFIGKYCYVFDSTNLAPGYPRPLSTLGLPRDLKKIDGAMIWGQNNRTYFFSGTMYWRFDESMNYVELDYPRDMNMFAGVGYNIDAVFQWKNGKTYFFKDKGYWEFDDLRMKVAHAEQKPSASFWMKRSPKIKPNDVDLPWLFYERFLFTLLSLIGYSM